MAHLNGNGKAILCRETNGFVRLIFEAYTNTLVGAQIMCPRATDMIGEMATAIANGLTAYQLSTAMRAHPTYSEAIAQAIEDALNNGGYPVGMGKKSGGISDGKSRSDPGENPGAERNHGGAGN